MRHTDASDVTTLQLLGPSRRNRLDHLCRTTRNSNSRSRKSAHSMKFDSIPRYDTITKNDLDLVCQSSPLVLLRSRMSVHSSGSVSIAVFGTIQDNASRSLQSVHSRSCVSIDLIVPFRVIASIFPFRHDLTVPSRSIASVHSWEHCFNLVSWRSQSDSFRSR